MPRVTSEYKEYTKRRILEEAARKFSEKGVKSTSMTEIAAALDMSKPVIYQYFRGKEALMEEVLKEAFDAYYGELLNEIKKRDPAIFTTGALYDTMWGNMIWSPVLVNDICGELCKNPELGKKILGAYTGIIIDVTNEFTEYQKLGLIDESYDPELLAVGLFGLLEGIGMQQMFCVDSVRAKAAWIQYIKAVFKQ